jgi:protease I
MSKLSNCRVAVIATDGFEESELTEPVRALRDAGAQVDIISLKKGPIQAVRHMEKGATVEASRALAEVDPDEYDAALLPGGALNADKLRVEPKVKEFVRRFDREDKPMAVICHAPWILVSAGLVRRRRLTSYYTIQDDIRNAGGQWLDRTVVEDANWVTSRQPSDLPRFNKAMIRLFAHERELAERAQQRARATPAHFSAGPRARIGSGQPGRRRRWLALAGTLVTGLLWTALWRRRHAPAAPAREPASKPDHEAALYVG